MPNTMAHHTMSDLSDTVCIIYTFLQEAAQGSLRQTNIIAAKRFDQAVDIGWIPAAGSSDIVAWDDRRMTSYEADNDERVTIEHSAGTKKLQRWRWFPVTRRHLWIDAKLEVLRVNIDAMAVCAFYRTQWEVKLTDSTTAAAPWNFLRDAGRVMRIFFHESKLLKTVGECFLERCRGLVAVDFRGLRYLTSIGPLFLFGCTALESVSFDGLALLTDIGDVWAAGCTSLSHINFKGLDSLATVGGRWLAGCTSLQKIDFAGCRSLTAVGDRWMDGCTSLEFMELDDLGSLTAVGKSWLQGCSSMEKISFEALSSVTTVDDRWLADCSSLTYVNFAGMCSLTTVGCRWMTHCSSLNRVEFNGLDCLAVVGAGWLTMCNSLTQIDLSGLLSLTEVGSVGHVGDLKVMVVSSSHPSELLEMLAPQIGSTYALIPDICEELNAYNEL